MQQAKIDFYLRFSRFQQSREKYYAPKIRKELDAQLQEYITTKKFYLSSTGIAKVITDLYADAATVYGGRIYQDLSKYIKQIKKKSFELKERKPIGFNERIIELMNEYFRTDILNTSRGITETTIRHIQDELIRGSGLGLGFDDIIKNLISEDLSANRARLIARTETVTAANRASYIVAVESGLKMNKQWLTSIDNRTRDHHIQIDGTVIGMDEYFILPNGVEMFLPGDRGGTNGKLKVPPGEVCNCRCTTVYIPVLDAQGNAVMATEQFTPVVVIPKPIERIFEEIPQEILFKPANNVAEAKERMFTAGVKKADIDNYSKDHYNQMLRAVESVPKKAVPTIITDKGGYEKFTQNKIKRKESEWMGLSLNTEIFDRDARTFGYEKIVVINSRGFKTPSAMSAKKIDYNNFYGSKKNGNKWYYNVFDGSTHFHELGHVYDNNSVSISTKPEWISIAEKWHKESNADLLKTTTGEWKGLNGSEAFAEAFASFYGNNKKGLPQYVIDFFIKNIK